MSEQDFNYKQLLYISLVYSDEDYQRLLENIMIFDPSISIYKKTDSKIIKLFNTIQMPVEYFDSLIEKLKNEDMFLIKNDKLYKLNSNIHTTILYTGGKNDVRITELQPHFNSIININIKSFAISDNFIVAEIEDLNPDIPYYGNPIKHITIGLKCKKSKTFKLLPMNSPSALCEGVIFPFEEPIIFNGILHPIMK